MKVQVDLGKLIERAAPQVFGADERNLLMAFASRYEDFDQVIEIELDECVLGGTAGIIRAQASRQALRHMGLRV